MPTAPVGLRWHQALAYAILGRGQPELGVQDRPDLAALAAELANRHADGLAGLRAEIAEVRTTGPWPRTPPAELAEGLGPAQFAAALTELRRRLDLDVTPRPTLSNRPLDAAEQALLRDVPPHHGS